MKKKGTSRQSDEVIVLNDRRAFDRLSMPSAAYAVDAQGNELGRVEEISGGGMQLRPASPFARVSLSVGEVLVITVVEPATSNRTDFLVEVRYLHSSALGFCFV